MKNKIFQKLTSIAVFSIIASLFFLSSASSQSLDVAYVPTPDAVVERMLDMADVGPGDYVIDLGCGDGRIVIAAARRGAYGHGVDLDPQRIKEARRNAKKAGVADNTVFVEQNIYDTDFSKANVITMYLFPSINLKLRPLLLKNLEPGSRIVSHDFGMDEWKPDQKHGKIEEHAVLLWVVPAQVEGDWSWEAGGKSFEMVARQKFQGMYLTILTETSSLKVENNLLSGRRISFTATDTSTQKRYVYSGRVEDGKIKGVVQIHDGNNKTVENWTASLK